MALTTVDSGLLSSGAQYTGFKNRIINGDMRIDQRNAGAEINPAVNGDLYTDRWRVTSTQTGKYKIGQNAGSVTPPAGFTKYLGVTSLSSYSVNSGDAFTVYQRIEGLNMTDLAWGTSDAKPVTLSFWVRSSLTGTFGGAVMNGGYDRAYPFTYTITSANTWEYKTVTIPGDTTGTWPTTNASWGNINFGLGIGTTYSGPAGSWASANYNSATGATSVVGTNGATFYITGVQLEKGSTATSFDYRPYGTELALCQRYYYKAGSAGGFQVFGFGYCSDANGGTVSVSFPVTMRTVPSFTSSAGSTFFLQNPAGNSQPNSMGMQTASVFCASVSASGSFTLTVGQGAKLLDNNNVAYLAFSSEL